MLPPRGSGRESRTLILVFNVILGVIDTLTSYNVQGRWEWIEIRGSDVYNGTSVGPSHRPNENAHST